VSRYVQHKSGVGELWLVERETTNSITASRRGHSGPYVLPKSEYIEVPAPDVWTDVSQRCRLLHSPDGASQIILGEHLDNAVVGSVRAGYRLRKVLLKDQYKTTLNCDQWAFIVEKREEPT
jgi:hypothetical protein